MTAVIKRLRITGGRNLIIKFQLRHTPMMYLLLLRGFHSKIYTRHKPKTVIRCGLLMARGLRMLNKSINPSTDTAPDVIMLSPAVELENHLLQLCAGLEKGIKGRRKMSICPQVLSAAVMAIIIRFNCITVVGHVCSFEARVCTSYSRLTTINCNRNSPGI